MTAILDGLTSLFIFAVGLTVLAIIVLFFIDRYQTSDAIRRNYPVIGRMRYILSDLGEFFRQYFFAMDREEMPFNRAQRDWVYDAAKGESTNVAFGSTRNLEPVGTPIFVNCPWPMLERDAVKAPPMRIGDGAARIPYDAPSLFNISGMSYGAISTPATKALSRGAAMAGCWMNTGEGGLAPTTSRAAVTSFSRSGLPNTACATTMETCPMKSCATSRRTNRSVCSS